MDPDALLKEIRETVLSHLCNQEIELDLFMEQVQALDAWLSGGGFLPKVWRNNREKEMLQVRQKERPRP